MRKIFGDKPAGKIVILVLALGLFAGMSSFAFFKGPSKPLEETDCTCTEAGTPRCPCPVASCNGRFCTSPWVTGCIADNPDCNADEGTCAQYCEVYCRLYNGEKNWCPSACCGS